MSALERLRSRIAPTRPRRRAAEEVVALHTFAALGRACEDVAVRFSKEMPAPVPPLERRLAALQQFHTVRKSLTDSEWRLVFAGLGDATPSHAAILDDRYAFDHVRKEVARRMESNEFARRDWRSLCLSYFGYDAADPEKNRRWQELREWLTQGLQTLKKQAGRERRWMRLVHAHRELFSEQAGQKLGRQMFEGTLQDLSALQGIAQIPESSWLWRRIFQVMVSRVFLLTDKAYLESLPRLLGLAAERITHRDVILSASLTRYHQSKHALTPHPGLRQATLDAWGSPQVRSRQNHWRTLVEAPVHAMVVRWFAKDDIEHFFNLLKNEESVDQARLFYWLRYVDQMQETRIVLGTDATSSNHTDFVDFRAANKGRLGQLLGGPSGNNAVMMRIGDYWFIEFSMTGNACYVYAAEPPPFQWDALRLDLNCELKQPTVALHRMRHAPAPSLPNLVEGWLAKYDEALAELGINMPKDADASLRTSSSKPARRGTAPAAKRPVQASSAKRQAYAAAARNPASTDLDEQLADILGDQRYQVMDRRSVGGAVQIAVEKAPPKVRAALAQIGFQQVRGDPLRFWMS